MKGRVVCDCEDCTRLRKAKERAKEAKLRGTVEVMATVAREAVKLWRAGPLYSNPEFASMMAKLDRVVTQYENGGS